MVFRKRFSLPLVYPVSCPKNGTHVDSPENFSLCVWRRSRKPTPGAVSLLTLSRVEVVVEVGVEVVVDVDVVVG
jgi:hypothetical protein